MKGEYEDMLFGRMESSDVIACSLYIYIAEAVK